MAEDSELKYANENINIYKDFTYLEWFNYYNEKIIDENYSPRVRCLLILYQLNNIKTNDVRDDTKNYEKIIEVYGGVVRELCEMVA